MVEIIVLSRSMAEKVKADVPHAFISITNPYSALADLQINDLTQGVLRLQFHDVEIELPAENEDEMTLFPMTQEMAGQVIDFVKSVKDRIELLIVHCEAGQSRSAGVGAAVSKCFLGTDEQWFKLPFTPNSTCYREVTTAFFGKMFTGQE